MDFIFDKSQRETLYPILIGTTSNNIDEYNKLKNVYSELFDKYLEIKSPITEGFTGDIILREISKNEDVIIVDTNNSDNSFIIDKPYRTRDKIYAPGSLIEVEDILIKEPYQLNFIIKDLDFITLIEIYKNLYNINILKAFNIPRGYIDEIKKLAIPKNPRNLEFFLNLSELEMDMINKLRDEINKICNTKYESNEIIALLNNYILSKYLSSGKINKINDELKNIQDKKKNKEMLIMKKNIEFNKVLEFNKYMRIIKTFDNWPKLKAAIKANKINTIEKLEKILSKKEIQLIRNAKDTMSKNVNCKHNDALRAIYKNNNLIDNIEAYIDHNIKDENKQLICNLCTTPIICTHIYRLLKNDYEDINEIYNEYKMDEPIGTKFYCRYCGVYLYTADYLEYKGFVKYSSIVIDEEETMIKNTTWGILKNLFQDVHFSSKINVELLFNNMNKYIFKEALNFDNLYKISDPETKKANLTLYIYIMGGLFLIRLISLQKEDDISFNVKYKHTKNNNELMNVFYKEIIILKWKSLLSKVSNIKEFIANIAKSVARFRIDDNYYNIANNKLIYDEILNNSDYKIIQNLYFILGIGGNNLNIIDEMFTILGIKKLTDNISTKNMVIPDVKKYIIDFDKIDKASITDKYLDYTAKYISKYFLNSDKYDKDIKYYELYFKRGNTFEITRFKHSTKLRKDLYKWKPIYYVKGKLGFYKWVTEKDGNKIRYKTLVDKDKYVYYDELDEYYKDKKIEEYTNTDKPKNAYILDIKRELVQPSNQEEYKEKINIDALKLLIHDNVNFNLLKHIGNYEGYYFKDISNDNIEYVPILSVADSRINKLHSYIVSFYIYLNMFVNNDNKFNNINKTTSSNSTSIFSSSSQSSSEKSKMDIKTNIKEYIDEFNKIYRVWNPQHIYDWMFEFLIKKLDSLYKSNYNKIKEFYNWYMIYILALEKLFTKVDNNKQNDVEFEGDDDFDFDEDEGEEDPYDDIDYEEDEDADFEPSD